MNNGDDKTQLVDTNIRMNPQFGGGPSLDLYNAGNQNDLGGSPQNGGFHNLKVSDLPNASAASTKWTRIPGTLGLGKLKHNFVNLGHRFKFIKDEDAPSKVGRNLQDMGRILKIVLASTVALICFYMIYQKLFAPPENEFFLEDGTQGLDQGVGGDLSSPAPLNAEADDSLAAQLGIDGLFKEVSNFLGIESAQNDNSLAPLPLPIEETSKASDKTPKPEKKPEVVSSTSMLNSGPKFTEVNGDNGAMFANPYWYLPNKACLLGQGFSRSLSFVEVEEFHKALQHPFFYQRHKLIDGIVSNRLGNSESILREAAYNAPRLWLRMKALIGLAELGYPVQLEDVERALGSDPTYRVSNYFKRFRDRGGLAEQYIMRYAIKIVGDKARRSILQAMRRDLSADNALYLAAAAFDSGSKTKKWLNQSRSLELIPVRDREKLRTEVVRLATVNTPNQGAKNGLNGKALIEESIELIDEPIN